MLRNKSTVRPSIVQNRQGKVLVNIEIKEVEVTNEMDDSTSIGFEFFQIRLNKNLNREELLSELISKVLDIKAKELGYDNIASVRSYTGFENVFKDECVKLSTWASSCWEVAGGIRVEVANGTREYPTIEESLDLLPVLA